MDNLDDYVKICVLDFPHVPVGTYIRWETKKEEMAVEGARIFSIFDRGWLVGYHPKKTFLLDWNREFIYVKKPLLHDYYMSKILTLTKLFSIVVDRIDGEFKEEFEEEAVRIQEEIETGIIKNQKKTFFIKNKGKPRGKYFGI